MLQCTVVSTQTEKNIFSRANHTWCQSKGRNHTFLLFVQKKSNLKKTNDATFDSIKESKVVQIYPWLRWFDPSVAQYFLFYMFSPSVCCAQHQALLTRLTRDTYILWGQFTYSTYLLIFIATYLNFMTPETFDYLLHVGIPNMEMI